MEKIRISNTGRLVIQPFELQEVIEMREADVVISRTEDLLDYLCIGLIALKMSVEQTEKKVIKVFRRSFINEIHSQEKERPILYDIRSGKDIDVPMNPLDIQRNNGNIKFLLDWMADEEEKENETKALFLYATYVSHILGLCHLEKLEQINLLKGKMPNEDFVRQFFHCYDKSLARFGDTSEAQLFTLQLVRLVVNWN